MPASRVLRAYLVEAKYEFLQKLRTPAFVIPLLLLPLGLYLLFLVVASPDIHAHPAMANFMFAGFAIFAVAGPALFGVGPPLAVERDAGLMTLKRALPAPKGAYLLSKTVMAVAFALLAGLFFPLPKVLQHWAVVWPALHLEQLALRASGLAQQSLSDSSISTAFLAAITLLFGGLAMRRLARAG